MAKKREYEAPAIIVIPRDENGLIKVKAYPVHWMGAYGCAE